MYIYMSSASSNFWVSWTRWDCSWTTWRLHANWYSVHVKHIMVCACERISTVSACICNRYIYNKNIITLFSKCIALTAYQTIFQNFQLVGPLAVVSLTGTHDNKKGCSTIFCKGVPGQTRSQLHRCLILYLWQLLSEILRRSVNRILWNLWWVLGAVHPYDLWSHHRFFEGSSFDYAWFFWVG